jgi:6-phosphogluconolactonase (cycloisomerase 2 family)
MHPPRLSRLIAGAAATLAVTAAFVQPARAESGDHGNARSVSQVYEATNAAAGNAIQVFERASDGTLSVGALVPTGGVGTGSSLASQGGVTREGNRLLVVNGGDNTVTSFVITRDGLSRRDVEPSGGVGPFSVTVSDNLVYVLNAGSDAITGFRLNGHGDLRPIAGSTRPLSGTGTGAAQVQFNRDGDSLVVTEKTTNKIDTFAVDHRGLVAGVTVTNSVGVTPYGFDIDRRDHVIVSEAATGSASSYQLRDGSLDVISSAVVDTQGAPCWLIASHDGQFAFTTNAASGTISSYRIARDGSLTLLAAVAGTPGAGPTDVAQSGDGQFLYARVRNGDIASFAVGADGSLTDLGTVTGATSVGPSGLAAS